MASAPLIRQHLIPLASLTAALSLSLYPTQRTQAEEPAQNPSTRQIRARKPIYDTPSSPTVNHRSTAEIASTTPPPASGITESPSSLTSDSNASPTASPRGPTPTSRLATQIRHSRLFLHTYAAKAEDSVNRGMDRVMDAENNFTSTIASLAPPKETNEKLLPGGIYVLVAAMAGSIISRNRNVALRFLTPIITGTVTAQYVIPHTTANVGGLIWSYEKRFPVIRDNHLRISDGVRHFLETGKAHSQMGLAMAEEKVQGVREGVEEWVKKGR